MIAEVAELLDLPDAIAVVETRGCPVVVPDPCNEHGRALYRALGVWIAEFQIERFTGRPNTLGGWLAQWKVLRDDGWDTSVLVNAEGRTVIGLACRIVRP